MNKLLLITLFACPILAMQKPTHEQLEQAKFHNAASKGAALALLYNGTIMSVSKGGCLLLGPIGTLGIAGAMGAKYAYDRSKGN